jgi:hypothetical protein
VAAKIKKVEKIKVSKIKKKKRLEELPVIKPKVEVAEKVITLAKLAEESEFERQIRRRREKPRIPRARVIGVPFPRRKKRATAITFRELGGRTIIDPTLTPLEALGRVKVKKRKRVKTKRKKKKR